MSEFGLEIPSMPTEVKLGVDGKQKGYAVKQSSALTIVAVISVLALLAGCLFLDIRAERTTFGAEISQQAEIAQHERMAKLESEVQLQQAASELSEQVGREKEEESDLKIMAQHIAYVQHTVRTNIHKTIDDTNLTVADIKKVVDEQFTAMETEVEGIMHDHLVTVTDANKKSQKAMHQMHESLVEDMKAQEEWVSKAPNPITQEEESMKTNEHHEHDKETSTTISQVFDHVYALAEKMGEEDIDHLLKPSTVKEWEQLLTDTEEGKVNYGDAVSKMENIITKAPAALKLAEATNAFELVHEDGGKKGVNEITNFRSLLKHVKWLPQYASVLEELTQWKADTKTTQQVLLWIQEQIQAGKLDDRWMAQAVRPTTAATATATAATTTTASPAAPATAATSGHAAAL